MHNELTNLLPQERFRALRRDYFLRLSIVVALFLIALTLISSLLLLPTYIFLAASARTKETRLANIESAFSSTDEAALSARLTALSNSATVLVSLANTPSVSAITRSALAVPHPGVALSGLAYKSPKTLSISGSSATRDALRGYQLAIQSAPFAKTANLPVSAYAKDIDIAFTITVTLAL